VLVIVQALWCSRCAPVRCVRFTLAGSDGAPLLPAGPGARRRALRRRSVPGNCHPPPVIQFVLFAETNELKRLFSGLRPVGPQREHYHQMGHHVVDA